jgi:hypothetical protein
LHRHLELDAAAVAAPRQGHPRPLRADPDELLVGARPRREALRTDVERLEQVCLAGPVRAGDEDDPRLQRELEPFVGAKVSKGDRADDQALFL